MYVQCMYTGITIIILLCIQELCQHTMYIILWFNMEIQGSRKLFWNSPAKIDFAYNSLSFDYMLQCKHITQHQCETPIDIPTHRQKIHEQHHTYKDYNIHVFALPTIILRPSESGKHNEAHTHYSRDHSTNLCMLYVCI